MQKTNPFPNVLTYENWIKNLLFNSRIEDAASKVLFVKYILRLFVKWRLQATYIIYPKTFHKNSVQIFFTLSVFSLNTIYLRKSTHENTSIPFAFAHNMHLKQKSLHSTGYYNVCFFVVCHFLHLDFLRDNWQLLFLQNLFWRLFLSLLDVIPYRFAP